MYEFLIHENSYRLSLSRNIDLQILIFIAIYLRSVRELYFK